MDLVICNTPLQVLQIESLINRNIIKENDFHLIFFVYNETEKLKYYFERLSALSNKSFYYRVEKFPFYTWALKKEIKKNNHYANIYTASIDNKFVHYLLSHAIFKNLFTVDDGSANIWFESCYYINKETKLKYLLHYFLGCRYDLTSLKKTINSHYTIYNGISNIISNTIYSPLFKPSNKNEYLAPKTNEIKIFLGSVYDEISDNKNALLHDLRHFFNDNSFYYIAHPRDEYDYFNNVKYIKDDNISEEIILNLRKKHNSISIYGFASSVQFNLANIDGITNYQLFSPHIKSNISVDNFDFKKIVINDKF